MALGVPSSKALQAQTFDVPFIPTGVATWNLDTNWEEYNPAFGQNAPEGRFDEIAVINSGGTAFVDVVFNDNDADGLDVRGPGQVVVSNGAIEIRNTGELTLGMPESTPMVDRSVVIDDRLLVTGNGKLNAGSITFGAGATYGLDLTATTAAPVTVDGAATLGGTLNLNYSGYANALGQTTLLTAGSITGEFANVNLTGLGFAKVMILETGTTAVTATVEERLSMTVNRETGAVSIDNPHGSTHSLDGYSIRSAAGSLVPGSLAGLGGDWSASPNNSSFTVVELLEGNGPTTESLSGGSMHPISAAGLYQPAPSEFLQETEDLMFEYTDPSTLDILQGIVTYVGDKTQNNIVLTVNSDGEAAMQNESPFPQEVEVYRVTSASSPLLPDSWDALADQGVDDGTWSRSAQSGPATLLELQEDGTTTFSSSNIYEIGKILNAGYNQEDITFEFLLAGDTDFTQGVVEFGELPSVSVLAGDYNNDGVVDSIDYAVWRTNLGNAITLPNETVTPGQVTPEDFDAWLANYGAMLASPAAANPAPEPSMLGWLGVLALANLSVRRRVKQLA